MKTYLPGRIENLAGFWLLNIQETVPLFILPLVFLNKCQLTYCIFRGPFLFAGHQVSSCYEEGSGIFDPFYGKGERGNDVRIISGPGHSLLIKNGI